MTKQSSPTATPNFMLCDFFNGQGKRVERLYIATEEDTEATHRLRVALRNQNVEVLLDAIMAEAIASGAKTDLNDAALALNALLNEIEGKRLSVSDAVQIASVSINFCKAVTIPEILPSLEAEFGGNAVCWVRGIFRHLDLGTPHMN